jgi:hypothetical protein
MKNFRYVQKTSAECNEDSYLAILHLSRVELHCKLQEKLHRVKADFQSSHEAPRSSLRVMYEHFPPITMLNR